MEPLTNVQRHSQARQCQIRLRVNGPLQLEVTDDGVGLRADHQAEVGIVSMHERATELGGFCPIESQPGRGTRVLASLPLSYRVQREGMELASPEASLPSRDRG